MSQLENNGHRKRLRDRFLKNNLKGFHEYEIIELFLTLFIPRHDVKKQAKLCLKKFGNINNFLNADIKEITSVNGIGFTTATSIKVIKAISELYLQTKIEGKNVLDDSENLIKFWTSRLRPLNVEVFEIAYVDSNLCLLKNGIEELERGTVDRANVYPRKVLEAALNKQASGIILAHNHPSGSAQPSANDEIITRRIKNAADYLDIKLIDHIIISKFDEFSFRENGLVF